MSKLSKVALVDGIKKTKKATHVLQNFGSVEKGKQTSSFFFRPNVNLSLRWGWLINITHLYPGKGNIGARNNPPLLVGYSLLHKCMHFSIKLWCKGVHSWYGPDQIQD